MKNMNKGIFLGFSSGILWAINSIVIGIILTTVGFGNYAFISPIIATFLNDFFSSIMIGIDLILNRKKITNYKVDLKNLVIILFASLLGAPIGMGGYVLSISFLGSAYTATFSVLYPVIGVLFAFILLKDKLTKRGLVGVSISVVATMILGIGSDNVVSNLGLGLIGLLMCIVGWGLEGVILSQVMSDLDERIILFIRQCTSVVSFLIILLVGFPIFDLFQSVISVNFVLLALISALAGSLSYLSYYKAIHILGPSKAMGLNISYSAWTVLFGMMFLSQPFDIRLILCCLAIIFGAILTSDLELKLGEKS